MTFINIWLNIGIWTSIVSMAIGLIETMFEKNKDVKKTAVELRRMYFVVLALLIIKFAFSFIGQ